MPDRSTFSSAEREIELARKIQEVYTGKTASQQQPERRGRQLAIDIARGRSILSTPFDIRPVPPQPIHPRGDGGTFRFVRP